MSFVNNFVEVRTHSAYVLFKLFHLSQTFKIPTVATADYCFCILSAQTTPDKGTIMFSNTCTYST